MPIELIDKIVPKNNGTFPMVDAKDVLLNDITNQRLDDALTTPLDNSAYIKTILVTQEEYDELGGVYEENTLYMVYIPSYSELSFHITSNLTQPIYLEQSSANAVTIDWGDGSPHDSSSASIATFSHTYAEAGDYLVKINCQDNESWASGVQYEGEAYGIIGKWSAKGDTYPTLTSAVFRDGASVGGYGFTNCTSLARFTMPSSATRIAPYTFYRCTGLVSINIPDSITFIGNYAFDYCSSLTSVVLPANVTYVDNCAFRGCTSLMSITSKNTVPPTIMSDTFTNVPANCPIYVPAASVDTYKAANRWSSRADYIQAIPE